MIRYGIVAGVLLGSLAAFVPLPVAADPAIETDPWQPMNREVFAFDMTVDRWVLLPVSKGWDRISNVPVRESVNNFFLNLRFPRRFVSKLLQGRFLASGEEVGRFVVNTTVGLLGFFDPATKIGLTYSDADFGQAFGVWGIGSGPYLVLPFFGPSSPRDTVGLVFDSLVSFSALGPYLFLATPVDWVNYRSLHADDVAEAKAASLDYYVFVRNAYGQQRYALIHHRKAAESPGAGVPAVDELYELEDQDD